MPDRLRGRNSESGFALLFIYAMAAIVAITLYMELPRVAFEAQRDKEQLLIDRGEQYSRAVSLYVRKFNKFPADFDALQNTQNLRFLRHKYVDPMTGKDDWRIVHVGPGGVFTDSLVYGKKKDDKQAADQQNFIGVMQQTGGDQTSSNQQGVNIGTRLRQSDQLGAPGDPNNPNQLQPSGPPQPGQPQFDANGQPIPNLPGPLPVQFQGANGLPPGAQPIPGQPFSTQQFQSGVQSQPVGFPPANGSPTAAANLINQLLTTPRPGGLNGLGGPPQALVDPNGNPIPNTNNSGIATSGLSSPTPTVAAATAAPVQIIGGGIAGVASKYEQDGIKVYKDQTSYNKWEFVYDITKDPFRGGGTVPQQAAPPLNGNPGAPVAPPPGANPAPAPPQTPVTPQ